MTVASGEVRTGPPRRASMSHRLVEQPMRAWCIHCGSHRDILPAGGARPHPVVNGHTVYDPATRASMSCPGAWAQLIPDVDPLAHWTLHIDDCWTETGLWCVCSLEVRA